MLVLCCEDIGSEFFAPTILEISWKAVRVPQIIFFSFNLAPPSKLNSRLFLRDGLQVKIHPAALLQQQAGQVLIVDSLLDQDNRSGFQRRREAFCMSIGGHVQAD